MKRTLTKRNSSQRSLFSSIVGLAGGRSRRRSGPGRLQLFGMSGTFGRGVVRHCDTWEVGDETPDRMTVRDQMHDIAQRRREEAIDRLGGEKKRGFYDFINR